MGGRIGSPARWVRSGLLEGKAMSTEFEIPHERLPAGFAEGLDDVPAAPATPRPAATIVLLRPGDSGPEVLLLKRNRTVGFVPGAFVFPGGRVDAADALPAVAERLRGISVAEAARRLRLGEEGSSAVAYYVAALREAFEETGILVGRDDNGHWLSSAAHDPRLELAQDRLHAKAVGFAQLLQELGATLDGSAIEYIAHWITPAAEPRRYDTRFFAVGLHARLEARPDGSEITEARWLTPADALRQSQEGRLPMVFPTIRTLRSFLPFDDITQLLESFQETEIPTILPRLVRTPTGVGIRVVDP